MITRKLLFLAAYMLSMGASAQFLNLSGSMKANHSSVKFQQENVVSSHRALAANQYLCGYYNTDDLATYGSGLGSYTTGVCKAATDFTEDIYKNFAGFKVVGMRVGLCESVSDFGVFISKVSGNSIVDYKSKDVGTGNTGWNTVMFDESEQFVLPEDGTEFIVGFNYYQGSGKYPISYYEGSDQKGSFLFYGNIPASVGGGGLTWYYLGSDGAMSVQLIVEGELSDQKIILGALKTAQYEKIGDNVVGVLPITNMGKTTVSSFSFDYYVDDVKAGETTVTKTIESSKTENVELNFTVPSDVTIGEHNFKFELTAIDGAAPKAEVTNNGVASSFFAYTDSKTRQKQLIEHITSWTCTYCYHGYDILRELEKQNSDIAWVAVHGNLHSEYPDPFNFEACNTIMSYLGANSFPAAVYNRSYIEELAGGDNTISYSLGYNTEQYLAEIVTFIRSYIDQTASVPSFATLDINSSFDATSRGIQVTVKGTGVSQASKLLKDDAIYVYITESGLVGQQYSSGVWQNQYDHNNVLRAVLSDVNGDDITWSGDDFTYTTSYTLPSDWKEENLYIVAFIAPKPGDIYKMAVNNCEKVQLNLNPAGIHSINSAATTEAARYTLDGRQISAPQHGINIVRMSDGSVRKVLVK